LSSMLIMLNKKDIYPIPGRWPGKGVAPQIN